MTCSLMNSLVHIFCTTNATKFERWVFRSRSYRAKEHTLFCFYFTMRLDFMYCRIALNPLCRQGCLEPPIGLTQLMTAGDWMMFYPTLFPQCRGMSSAGAVHARQHSTNWATQSLNFSFLNIAKSHSKTMSVFIPSNHWEHSLLDSIYTELLTQLLL